VFISIGFVWISQFSWIWSILKVKLFFVTRDIGAQGSRGHSVWFFMIFMNKTRIKKIVFWQFCFFSYFFIGVWKIYSPKIHHFRAFFEQNPNCEHFWPTDFPSTDEKTRKKPKFEKIIFLVLVLPIKIIKNQAECPCYHWASISRVTKKASLIFEGEHFLEVLPSKNCTRIPQISRIFRKIRKIQILKSRFLEDYWTDFENFGWLWKLRPSSF